MIGSFSGYLSAYFLTAAIHFAVFTLPNHPLTSAASLRAHQSYLGT